MRTCGLGLVTVTCLIACRGPHVQTPSADRHDGAYLTLRARADGCPRGSDQPACCAKLNGRLDQALAGDDMGQSAVLLDALAISCPAFRGNALAALQHRPRAGTGGGGLVAVTFVVELGPQDRLYWLGAFLRGRHSTRTEVEPGVHPLQIEAHLMTTGKAGDDKLYNIRASRDVVVQAGKGTTVTVMLKRADTGTDNPFVISLPAGWRPSEQGITASELKAAFARDKRDPDIQQGKLVDFGAYRYPSELRAPGLRAVSRVCVNRDGRVIAVTPLSSPHPRYTATLVDGLFRARYDPYKLNGEPIPFCYSMHLKFD
jgi:hypothetical protein